VGGEDAFSRRYSNRTELSRGQKGSPFHKGTTCTGGGNLVPKKGVNIGRKPQKKPNPKISRMKKKGEVFQEMGNLNP